MWHTEDDAHEENDDGNREICEPTPTTAPEEFENLRGQRAKRHKHTKEIWELDQLHKDHYEVYATMKDFEKGKRNRAVWNDGRLKEQF